MTNLVTYSTYGFFGGFFLGLFLRRKLFFGALGSGIGGGMAFNTCASSFNYIDRREQRVAHDLYQDKPPTNYSDRVDDFRQKHFGK